MRQAPRHPAATLASTLAYLRAGQVVSRLLLPFKRAQRPSRQRWTGRRAVGLAGPFKGHDPWNSAPELRKGRYRFLNEGRDLGDEPDWDAPGASLHWRYHLQSFAYLYLLDKTEQRDLCHSWIAHDLSGTGVGWDPYPTSRRIVAWCQAGMEDSLINESLHRQASWLKRNLETHLLGNHLLENARALILAGVYFGDDDSACKWLTDGLELLEEQTVEQVLPDGMHVERSPMYHALMLEAYLDVLQVLPADHGARDWLERTVHDMASHLAAVTHPDGGIALLNDATLEVAPPSAHLLSRAERLTGETVNDRRSFADGGLFVHRSEDLYLVIDGGAVGPDYLPAHAHADIFSYELSVRGLRFVVDTGVHDYERGEMREHVRSTAAHNTVSVDGMDQAECWDVFRVGRRLAPSQVRFRSDDAGAEFTGVFEGHARWIGDGLVHSRTLCVDDADSCLTVHDRVGGTGEHLVESRIHLHPDVDVRFGSGELWLSRAGRLVRLEFRGAQLSLDEGWYCPRFGTRVRNKVLNFRSFREGPHDIQYVLDYAVAPRPGPLRGKS